MNKVDVCCFLFQSGVLIAVGMGLGGWGGALIDLNGSFPVNGVQVKSSFAVIATVRGRCPSLFVLWRL